MRNTKLIVKLCTERPLLIGLLGLLSQKIIHVFVSYVGCLSVCLLAEPLKTERKNFHVLFWNECVGKMSIRSDFGSDLNLRTRDRATGNINVTNCPAVTPRERK